MITLHNSNLLQIGYKHLVAYPTSSTINYFWSFGSLAGIILVVQILTGIFLAMHYTPHCDFAFDSVEHIMRDVSGGWLLRYLHSNGASFFFIVVYTHIARNLYWFSFGTRRAVWYSGVTIFLLLIIIAFLGYVLPWGQMSFWAATVITNLFTAVPLVGKSVAQWLWGGFAIGNPTLNRFFSLHYLLPFLVVGLVIAHLSSLHQVGSTNPAVVSNEAASITNKNTDYIAFFPYFYFKDLFMLFLFISVYLLFVFFLPNQLGHPDNYILANSLVTPAHLVPEWYFLPFYAILRSVPSKLGGFVCMIGSILLLFLIPLLRKSVFRVVDRNTGNLVHVELSSELSTLPTGWGYRWLVKVTPYLYYIFIFNSALLMVLGGRPVEYPFVAISQYSTIVYFVSLLVYSQYGCVTRGTSSHFLSRAPRRGSSPCLALLYISKVDTDPLPLVFLKLLDLLATTLVETFVFFSAMSALFLPQLFLLIVLIRQILQLFLPSWVQDESLVDFIRYYFLSVHHLDRFDRFTVKLYRRMLSTGMVFWFAWSLSGRPVNFFSVGLSPLSQLFEACTREKPTAFLFLFISYLLCNLVLCIWELVNLASDRFFLTFAAFHAMVCGASDTPRRLRSAYRDTLNSRVSRICMLNLYCLSFYSCLPCFEQAVGLLINIPWTEVHLKLTFGFLEKSKVVGAATGVPCITLLYMFLPRLVHNYFPRLAIFFSKHEYAFLLLFMLVELFHLLSLTLSITIL